RIPRRSGGSFALNSGGSTNLNGAAIRKTFALSPRTSQRFVPGDLIPLFFELFATVVRELSFPIFLCLETFACHAFGCVGSEENENVRYICRISPFGRIFLRFGGPMHCRVHTAGIDPVYAHVRLLQF